LALAAPARAANPVNYGFAFSFRVGGYGTWTDPLIDGVLQFDFSRPGGAAGAAEPLVVGPENGLLAPPLERLLAGGDLAEAAASFNPLAIVGPAGSGKSHVAQGLVRVWGAQLDADALAYFTAADFGRELQAAQAEERLTAWRQKVRGLRMLVVEDVDHLRRRATIQRELRSTVDAIIAAGGLVVVTALCEPMTCTLLDIGLRDRLAAGLTVRLRKPALAARRAILTQATAARGVELSPAELDSLATKECSTAAELLGRLATHENPGVHAGGAGGGGRMKMAELASLKHILAVTARYFGLTQAAISSKSRRTSLVQARNVVVHLARRMTDLSYTEIGRALGGRDHTTIMHADQHLAERLATDPATQHDVEELGRLVGA
jgi:chromosomal replication initiator protein